MTTSEVRATRGNVLLGAFSEGVRQWLEVHDEHHESHVRLISAGETPEWLYFPHRGTVISMTRSTTSGATVEVGIVGWEGLVTVQSLLSPGIARADAVVQIAGGATRARLKDVRELLNDDSVRDILLAATGAFLAQVSQHAVCNRLHSIEQRLAKWLLGVRDRIDTDKIALTHDLLAHMLGIRRPGVTVAIGALALDGMIRHERNGLTILDRESLELRACECYSVIRDATPPAAG